MRSSSSLLLVLLLGLLGFGGFLYWGSLDPTQALELGSETSEQQGSGAEELPHIEPGAGAQASGREAILEESPERAGDTSLSTPELVKLDSNALFGTVVDAEGNGIADCEIRFLAGGLSQMRKLGGGAFDGTSAPLQVTDSLGRYRFEDLVPGDQHALRVHHPEISLLFVEGVTVGAFGDYEEPPILLQYGKRVRGVVTNELDDPLVGVQLHLDGQWRPTDPQPSYDRLSTVTNEKGEYEILGVPDGVRCLTAVADGLGRLTRIQSLIFSDQTGQAHLVNLKLKGANAFSGRVTDPAGAGIGGVDVLAVDRKAYRDVGNDRTTTLPDGTFSMSNLSRGVYQVIASAPGYRTVTLNNVTGPVENLNLIMGDRRVVRGKVVDAESGEGLTAFELQFLRHQNGEDQLALPTGEPVPVSASEGGAFELPLVSSPGMWQLQGVAEGYAPSVSQSFQINPSGDVVDVVVAMTRGGTIRGRLLDSSGAAVVGGRITSRDNNWSDDAFSQMVGGEEGHLGTVLEARSGRDGSFVLPNLRPATYQLIARSAKFHQVVVRALILTEGAELDVGEIVMPKGGGLHGTLLDAEGSPTAGGMIFLNPKDPASGAFVRRCKSSFDGRWRLKNIVPGTYRLTGKEPTGADMGALGMWPGMGGEEIVIAGGVDDLRDVHLTHWTKPKPPEPEPPTGQLNGKLLNSAGVGIVGGVVKLTPVSDGASPAEMGKTAREGSFTFLKLLPGDYDLMVMDQPASVRRITIRIDAWTNQDLVSAE